ncbi:MAG: hypothetical protein GFH27_549305n215 [Chloroflexi bacterium AL-W]|nr:hypothetical protein [Chloroflexi bacterium AL-N1]NOK71233.1 hypothetical protein [Chloroflexi bacterium AL-N10]NOK76522.1 hypothetical protein [Chloroflexi bacterium AL-N5]NOK83639.1 hypothetical protein [Chloroflexi bacterium AL-W]NOK92239.1 hypothetical protein [Chloroflexi bacterium AL-N15]
MLSQRVKTLLGFLGVALFFASFPLYEYSQRAPTPGEIVSIGGGVLIGLGLSLYFNQLWNPVTLSPTRPDTTDPNVWWLRHAQVISVLLGVGLSAVSRLVLGQELTSIVAVGALMICIMFFLNFAFRLLWYWPR